MRIDKSVKTSDCGKKVERKSGATRGFGMRVHICYVKEMEVFKNIFRKKNMSII